MRPLVMLLACTASALSVAPSSIAQSVDKKALLAQLDAPSAIKRQVAYGSLEEGPGKRYLSAGLTEITRLLKADISRYDKACNRLTGLVPIDTKKRQALWTKRLKRWDEKRPKAAYAVMDDVNYPAPGPTNIMRGPWKGARKVTAAFKAARKAFEPFDSTIAAAMTGLGTAEKLAATLAALKADLERIAERRAVLERNKRRPPKVEAVALDFFELLLLLLQEKYDEANKRAGGLPAIEKALYFVAYCYRIIAVNKTITLPAATTTDCRWAMGEIDKMRMCCGFLPMEHNAILTETVFAHLNWCRRTNIFSHYTRDPKTRTPNIRCKAAGWKGMAAENLADCQGPKNCITVWMWDGAHARNMLAPRLEFIGFADNGWTGMNVGYGVKTKVPRPVFYPVPKVAPK